MYTELSSLAVCVCVWYIHITTEAHGATDVTGFGILGHTQNLVSSQKNSVNFSLHTLPSKYVCIDLYTIKCSLSFSVFNKMSVVATAASNAGLDFKLHAGYSAETSGSALFNSIVVRNITMWFTDWNRWTLDSTSKRESRSLLPRIRGKLESVSAFCFIMSIL